MISWRHLLSQRSLDNVYPVYLGTLWPQECWVPGLPRTSGLTWKCRLTWCSVQIQIIVSAFSNLAKCLQKKKKKYIYELFTNVSSLLFFHPKCFSTCNSVSGHWRTVGQKNIWKKTSFVYQRQCSAFGRMVSVLLPHSLLKSCHKNKLFPFEINFDTVFCNQPSVAASLFLRDWVGVLLSFLCSLSDILLLLSQRRRKNWFENLMRSSVKPMRRWVWGFHSSWWLKYCCLKKEST